MYIDTVHKAKLRHDTKLLLIIHSDIGSQYVPALLANYCKDVHSY